MAEFNGKQIMLVGLKGDKGEKGDKGDKGDVGDNFVIYPENYLKEIVISAYNDEEFRNSIAFSYATDKDDEGNIIYGNIALITEEIINDENNQPIGAEYSMICNGLLYHITLRENGSDYDFEVENPYYRKDDEVLAEAIASVSNAKVGITSQYVSQPSDVKEGSNIYINAKLRDSVNLFDVNVSGNWGITAGGHLTTFTKLESGVQFTLTKEIVADDGVWINTPHLQLQDLGLNVGDTIILSANTSVSNSNNKLVIMIHFYDESGADLDKSVVKISPQGGGNISITPTIIPSGTNSIKLFFSTNYDEDVPANTIYTFTDVQLQKGSVATTYEPYGAYSKGKVMQYVSKNILNLPSCTEVSVSSVNGSQTSSDTYERASASTSLKINMRGSQVYAKYVKGHKYALLIHSTDNDFSEFEYAGVSLLRSNGGFIVNTVDESFVTDTPNVYAITVTWTAETQIGRLQPYLVGGSSLSITVDLRAVIDLTSAGYHAVTNLTQYVNGLSLQLDALASGGSLNDGMYRSPLIKVFDKNLYLTKPNTYTLTIYEFKENPKSLNANVDIDDYEFIKASEYSSSGAITLQPNTNSIVYFLYASSSTDLSTWQSTSQLEYGNVATEHIDYTAPIEIGTFDKEVDGNEKTFSFVVLGTENQNIGFIPASENDISIDFVSDVSDTTKSTFAYSSTNLANQVAELESRVSDLETEVFELQEKVNELENLQVPSVPDTGRYVLECIDGVLTWVIKE